MWLAPEALSTAVNVAQICWAWLPTITTILRLVTAIIAFTLGIHRTIRYIRDARCADQEILVSKQRASRSRTSARRRSRRTPAP